MKIFVRSLSLSLFVSSVIFSQTSFESDTIQTSGGDLTITFYAHASLRLDYRGQIIYFDPSSGFADFTNQPVADLILVTHHHYDHLDTALIRQLSTSTTRIIGTAGVSKSLPGISVLKNDELLTLADITIEAVPAYNMVHERSPGMPFHPKGEGNGYVLKFGGTSVYVAGDTEDIPEMKNLEHIDIAFLPMNLPYTMDPSQVLSAVKLFHPKVLYPYHTGDTHIEELVGLMDNTPEVKDTEVRIRKMP